VTVVLAACALVAAAASLVVVLKPDVLHGALGLITVLLALAAIYAALGAWFLAAVQVIVYAGAVVVLFMFAIMVLESRREPASRLPGGRLHRVAAGLAGAALFAALAGAQAAVPVEPGLARLAAPGLSRFARHLFEEHLLSFEAVGLLLLVALVAIVVLVGRREET
jgi:NADH-quinone oxidoreductase subunit J